LGLALSWFYAGLNWISSEQEAIEGNKFNFYRLYSKGGNDIRPISLVGCMYKVLAKVLANRLRSVIGTVVSDSQSAFVKGKQILDGILIAIEAVEEAWRRKKEMFLFKVDFEKAYDSAEWKYLDSINE
jgi:hypothetical protein